MINFSTSVSISYITNSNKEFESQKMFKNYMNDFSRDNKFEICEYFKKCKSINTKTSEFEKYKRRLGRKTLEEPEIRKL